MLWRCYCCRSCGMMSPLVSCCSSSSLRGMKESPQLIPMEISTKIHHLVDIKESYIIMIFSIQMELYCTTLLLLLMLLLWLQMLWHGVPSRLILPRAKIVKEGITVGEALHRFVGWLVGWFVDWLVGLLLVGYVCVCVCVCVGYLLLSHFDYFGHIVEGCHEPI
jgi:hypothetical protein